MKNHEIFKYKVSIDDMFDSPGVDIYSLSVSYIFNDKLELLVGSINA